VVMEEGGAAFLISYAACLLVSVSGGFSHLTRIWCCFRLGDVGSVVSDLGCYCVFLEVFVWCRGVGWVIRGDEVEVLCGDVARRFCFAGG
jgi:hypothetical protein